MKSKQQGFTLVELVVVIVILGILAATALPKFINVTTDARIAALNGVAGAIRSSVSLTQSRYVATGDPAAVLVTLADGTTAAVSAGANGGIPTLAGIASAVSANGFTYTAGTGVYDFAPTAIANCFATYAVTGAVTLTTTGC